MCCIHCAPTPEEVEDAAFRDTIRYLKGQRRRSIAAAIRDSRPVINIQFQSYPPRFQQPTIPDPDRPRGL